MLLCLHYTLVVKKLQVYTYEFRVNRKNNYVL